MKSEFLKSWALLKPHAKPRLPALGVVLLLGFITAALQTSVLLMFGPIWDLVLFAEDEEEGGPAEVVQVDEPATPGAPVELPEVELNAVTEWFVASGAWIQSTGMIEGERMAILAALVGIALAIAFVAGAAQYGFSWLSRLVSLQMIVDLRVRLARHLMGLSVRYHGERRFGDLLSRVSSDVTTTLNAINVGMKSMVLEPLMAIGAILVAFDYAPLPTVGILVLLPIVAWPISKLASRVRKGSRRSLSSLGESVQALSQMFQGIRTVKSFGGEEREIVRYREINEGYLKTSMRMVRAVALTHSWTAFFSIAGVAGLIGILGVLAIQFEWFSGGGQLTGFFIAIARLNNHVKNFTRALTRVEESVGASTRIQDLLDEPADVVEAEEPVRVDSITSAIRFENVSFRYPDSNTSAIEGVSLDVQPGETLALVGVSGAGKSTLIDLVARFVDPSEGSITVDGKDLRELSLQDWTALYAMVGQVPFLFHATIGENIRYGKPDATDEEVRAAAKAADIDDFVMSLPAGYETDVADMGSRLSGGQRQRITIARALLKGAPLLLLDEATSALDSQSEAEVQTALERLMQDRTVIVIAHRLSTIRNADRIAVLEAGRLVELGRHDELISRDGPYARLSSLQKLGTSDTPRGVEV